MKSEYSVDELLPISGIQHFVFCRRQWALIHVECQWQENALTISGKLLHEKADDPFFTESRKNILISRSVPVSSFSLGLTGKCDAVEFTADPGGVQIPGRKGLYLPAPVEYKHGKTKTDRSDEAQLCAQAMCLEEMLLVNIPIGYLYYAATRSRQEISISKDLRDFVRNMSIEMHGYYQRGYVPNVKISKACKSCSLQNICLPVLQNKTLSASRYILEQTEMD